ncbi:TIGR02217 family protein, partial [Sphingomonas sp. PsM26]|nr:TIGR02217 family protein [Sphingomonas sp. PsM26]
MAYWLATERTVQEAGVISRFDPRFWTVDFPRPMMAAVTTTAPDGLRVDAVFHTRGDLAGLIWEAEDTHDHPLLRYATARDFRTCRLVFRWRAAGVVALDAVNGPVLTIEGRDAGGAARAWYVRLWNYAVGTPADATITLDFGDLEGGFVLPGEADPVWAGDVDRMFVSLVPPGYGAGSAVPLAVPVEAWVELSAITCEGSGAVLAMGDVIVPEHGLSIASGYDDSYHLTPARLLRNALLLGYRGSITHYVGMSHYMRLEANSGGYYVSLAGGVLNIAAAAWHRSFAAEAKA